MPIINPFANSIPEGDIWGQGFMAGFNLPDSDPFLPLAPTLLEAYREGAKVGRDFKRAGPEEGTSWEGFEELNLNVTVHAVLDLVADAFGGMIALVIEALQIPGDTPLKPLPDDFRAPANQGDANYVAVCLRTDHALVTKGVSSEGTWSGSGHTVFTDALSDMKAHEHAETFIARCSVQEQTCGAVWPIN